MKEPNKLPAESRKPWEEDTARAKITWRGMFHDVQGQTKMLIWSCEAGALEMVEGKDREVAKKLISVLPELWNKDNNIYLTGVFED